MSKESNELLSILNFLEEIKERVIILTDNIGGDRPDDRIGGDRPDDR